jgi:hypothetical protein
MKTAKSLGFCFKHEKEKTKQKDFAMCVAERIRWLLPYCSRAQPISATKNNNKP